MDPFCAAVGCTAASIAHACRALPRSPGRGDSGARKRRSSSSRLRRPGASPGWPSAAPRQHYERRFTANAS